MNDPTQTELDAALAYWQKVLRIQDWRIFVTLNDKDPESEYRTGYTAIHPAIGAAAIYLTRPSQIPSNCIDKEGPWEQVLVHELLHVAIDCVRGEGPYDAEQERAVERLAWGFYSLKPNDAWSA